MLISVINLQPHVTTLSQPALSTSTVIRASAVKPPQLFVVLS